MGNASVQTEATVRIRPGRLPWTDEEDAVVRSMWRRGADVASIAEATRHPFGSVQTHLTRLGLRDLPRCSPARERVVDLARDGWTVSRIAKQVGAQEPVVERVIVAAGLVPRVLYSYGRGRYGEDLPLPTPGAPKLALAVPVHVLAPKPDKPHSPRHRWTSAESEAFDAAVLAGAPMRDVAGAFGRTTGACYNRAYTRQLVCRVEPRPDLVPDLLERAAAAAAARNAPVEDVAPKPGVWTGDELRILRTMSAECHSTEAIAERLGRAVHAVRRKRTAMGLKPTFGSLAGNARGWSDADVERLADLANAGLSTAAIAREMGRSPTAVAHVKWRHSVRTRTRRDASAPAATPTKRRVLRPGSVTQRIHAALVAAKGEFVSTPALLDALYAHDPDGGPLTATNLVRVSVARLRESGLVVESRMKRGYRLVEEAAA